MTDEDMDWVQQTVVECPKFNNKFKIIRCHGCILNKECRLIKKKWGKK